MKEMKRTSIALLLLFAAACSKQPSNGDGSGFVSLSLSPDNQVAEITKGNVSDYTALPSTSDFNLVIKNSSSEQIFTGKVSEWNSGTPLTAGTYSVSASYGEEGVEGFDKPYFAGNTSFDVVGGKTTSVSVPVALANAIVKVVRTEAFNNYYVDSNFKVTTGNGNVINFPKTQMGGAFVDAYRFSVSGTVTSQSGRVSQFNAVDYNSVDAATCYTLRFDVSNVGSTSITISFDDTTVEVPLSDIELNE